MLITHTNTAQTTWKILISPTETELKSIMKELQVPDEYFEELVTPTPQPICNDIQGTIYAVFHIPVHKKTDAVDLHYVEEEIDILMRDNTIVMIIHSPLEDLGIDPTYAISRHPQDTALDILLRTLTYTYKQSHSYVDALVIQVKELREKVFTSKEHIATISDIHRAYLAIDFPIDTHGDIIDSILTKSEKYEKSPSQSKTKTQGELHRLTQKLEKLGAYIHELRDTQSILISAKQNSLIQTFTILTFVFLPINFLAAVFGMNVINMPVVAHPLAFWILTGCFASLSLLLLIFFKIRKWL